VGNLIFTGGPGTGKSRATRAVACTYHGLGQLSFANVVEVTAADLASTTSRETATLVSEAVRSGDGRVLMINDAHAWDHPPGRGQQMLRCLNHGRGNARLAGRLLNEATASQALRVTTTSPPWDRAMLSTIHPRTYRQTSTPTPRQLTNVQVSTSSTPNGSKDNGQRLVLGYGIGAGPQITSASPLITQSPYPGLSRELVHASPEMPLMILAGAPHWPRSGAQTMLTCQKRLAVMIRCDEDGAMACKPAGQGHLPKASLAKLSPTTRA
jgi:hypothetical protein